MTFEVILEIRICQNSADEHSGIVAVRLTEITVRLAEMGGCLKGWRPAMKSAPARAYFTFNNEDERECFLSRALNTPGVSLTDADYVPHGN